MAIDDKTTATAKELGKLFGVTARRVRQLHEEGVFERSARGRYPVIACTQAYIAGIAAQSDPEDLQRERVSLVRAQTRRIEQTIRDREAAEQDLDWQDHMIRAITFECQMRVRLMAAWLWTTFGARNLQMDGALDALAEICHHVSGWSAGIRRELEADFLAVAREARRKQIHVDSWQKLIDLEQAAKLAGRGGTDDSGDDSGHAGNGVKTPKRRKRKAARPA